MSEHTLNNLKQKLLDDAQLKHGINITPCGNKKSLSECFTINGEYLVFWYNTPDHGTHVQRVKIPQEIKKNENL